MMDAVEDEVLEHDDCTDEKKGFVRTSLSLSLFDETVSFMSSFLFLA